MDKKKRPSQGRRNGDPHEPANSQGPESTARQQQQQGEYTTPTTSRVIANVPIASAADNVDFCDFAGELDAACTISAALANELAFTARALAYCDRDRCDTTFGADVARFARLATTAATAANLLHRVQADYVGWVEVTP